MSNHTISRSLNHKVKHIFSRNTHFFEVESESGKKYEVAIRANCTCKFQSIQGCANDEVCSHILAVFRKISEAGKIKIETGVDTNGNENFRDKIRK